MNCAKTACEKCVFAEFNHIALVRSQTGCKLGRLSKFEQLGVTIERKVGLDGRETCIISRICMAARQESWAKNKPEDKLPEFVRKELTDVFRPQVYLVVSKQTVFDDVFITVDSLARQTILPANLRLVLTDGLRPTKYIRRLFAEYNQKLPKWDVQQIATTERDESGKYPDFQRSIDIAVQNCESFMYGTFLPGFVVPTHFVDSIDRAVNDELKTFAALQGHDEFTNVILTAMHHRLGGNQTTDMVESESPDSLTEEEVAKATKVRVTGIVNKLRFLSETVGLANLVLPMESVCTVQNSAS